MEEPEKWSSPEGESKVRLTIAGTAGVGALLIINNYRRAVCNFINDEISRYTNRDVQAETDSDDFTSIIVQELGTDHERYNILMEFGFIDDIRERLGHSPALVAGIIASLLGLDENKQKDLAKIKSFAKRYSQYGTSQKNDSIGNDAQVELLEKFLSKYGLEPKRVFKRKKK